MLCFSSGDMCLLDERVMSIIQETAVAMHVRVFVREGSRGEWTHIWVYISFLQHPFWEL